jgi:hypothetical protein
MLAISAKAYCVPDTIDFCRIYLNDSLLSSHTYPNGKMKITLRLKELKDTDVLKIDYFTDAPTSEGHVFEFRNGNIPVKTFRSKGGDNSPVLISGRELKAFMNKGKAFTVVRIVDLSWKNTRYETPVFSITLN